ncbi:RNA polymerase sigma factor [Plantactinospora siamensis]|uniref:RNA polymerase sigma factor n=1 Tax=Plantactinospora siamensis TaxID=555372 RepID=A0ABV6P5M0_9ACTN
MTTLIAPPAADHRSRRAPDTVTADLTAAVRAAQRGDEDAFRIVYRTVQPGLLRYLTVLVGADAEDVASETWLQIARDLAAFDGGPGFRAWAATIARHRALDHLRHRRRRPVVTVPMETLAELLPAVDDTAQRATDGLATDNALALIATLPQREAEAVLLRAVLGLDAESAGQIVGRRPGAIRTAAHRGLRRLAAMLAEDGAGAGQRPAAGPPGPRRGSHTDPSTAPTVSGRREEQP